MIDPSTTHIDAAAERSWLLRHKSETGLSWKEIADRSGIPQGTVSQFGPGTYKGDNDDVARKVVRYRQTVEAQAELLMDVPQAPGFVPTRTATQINRLLAWAHMGKMVVIAGGPGLGKTRACENYAAGASNVFMATMSQSSAGLNPMQMELLAAMGEPDATGTPQKLSRRICDKVRGKRALIVIDEAQALTEKALEELRAIHDRTGVGLVLVGNDGVLQRLEGGARKAAYAQLYSRVGMRMIRNVPLTEDAVSIAEAWGLTESREINFIVEIATKPGGLRSATMVMELATMLGLDDGERTLTHLRAAWAQLSTRPMAA